MSMMPVRPLPIRLLAVALLSAACTSADAPLDPVAPPGSPGYTVLEAPRALELLQRTPRLRADVAVRATIGPDGGSLAIPEAGLLVEFTPGAVREPTEIVATALAGRFVAYEFQPHGLQFDAPVRVVQEVSRRTVAGPAALVGSARAGYFADRDDLDASAGIAWVVETMPLHPAGAGAVSFEIRHFSGYLLSSGRQAAFR